MMFWIEQPSAEDSVSCQPSLISIMVVGDNNNNNNDDDNDVNHKGNLIMVAKKILVNWACQPNRKE